ncbi:hypothetical protein NL676_037289 [Syzygium grande]|nr:hypothetical protein NL676_037289 [Syzygium grande]
MSIAYRPSHADATYDMKYGVRSVQGGGRSSTRETIGRVTYGAIAKKIPKEFSGTKITDHADLTASRHTGGSAETSRPPRPNRSWTTGPRWTEKVDGEGQAGSVVTADLQRTATNTGVEPVAGHGVSLPPRLNGRPWATGAGESWSTGLRVTPGTDTRVGPAFRQRTTARETKESPSKTARKKGAAKRTIGGG